ncbi:MAG: DEAD/DEAH box helicase [Cyclobacteriaceae bacterium]|nr:DEAD/DEAH box helicase [Cyclobacteriaceae bacterium HetDA_MAG_MS6]
MKFSELGLAPQILEGIEAMGFEEATPIQQQAIPTILSGKDLIGSAQTGTGKTAAFLLPILDKITQNGHRGIQALIVAPTRELAIQIDQQIEGLSYYTNVSSIPVYGGGDGDLFSREKQALMEGADVVVGTPGRLIAHLTMKYVNTQQLSFLVLDEADRMLDMGFHQDINRIISFLPEKRQNLLFSATMPPKIRELARKVLTEPEEINIAVSVPAEKIAQLGFVVYEEQKIPMITHFLKVRPLRSVIIFCSTKDNTKRLARELKKAKLSVEDIHSDLEQKAREEVLTTFKSRKLSILVATDILSRGIDIEEIDLVINFDVPNDGEDYIHRIGRTARAASKGAAYTFINEKEQGKFLAIENLIGSTIPKVNIPEQFGEAPDYSPRPIRKGRKGGRRKR